MALGRAKWELGEHSAAREQVTQALALIGWLINVIGDAAERSVEIDEVEDED